jgi:hypothetical protein
MAKKKRQSFEDDSSDENDNFNEIFHNDEQKIFEDNYYKSYKKKQKRLEELSKREAYIREQKHRLQAEKSWFKKPQNIIGLFAVLFPIVVSLFLTLYKEDIKELTIFQSETKPLIIDSERIRTNVTIKQDSSEIKNIYKISFTLVNTGNVTLDKTDFSDGPLNMIMDFHSNSEISNIIEVFKRNDANQQNSLLKLKREKSKDIIQYMPSLLNKGDEVVFDVYLLSNSNLDINIIGKIREGNIIGPIARNKNDIVYGYKTFVKSIQSMLGYKWLAIIFFIILFILTALSSLFQGLMTHDDELDPKPLGILITITTSLISILSIVILVSIISS